MYSYDQKYVKLKSHVAKGIRILVIKDRFDCMYQIALVYTYMLKFQVLNSIYGQLNQVQIQRNLTSTRFSLLLARVSNLFLWLLSPTPWLRTSRCHQFRLKQHFTIFTRQFLRTMISRDFCSSFSIVVVLTQNWKLNWPTTESITLEFRDSCHLAAN